MEPWERHPGESRQAFQAFAAYRDMDSATRSLARVGQELGKSTALMERWSARWSWTSRVTSYDAELDRQRREHREREIEEANERHVNLARAILSKVVQRLNSLDPEDIPVTALDRLVKTSTDLELRALGEPTETVRQERTGKGGGPIRADYTLSLAERLAQYDHIIRDVANGKTEGSPNGHGSGQSLDSP